MKEIRSSVYVTLFIAAFVLTIAMSVAGMILEGRHYLPPHNVVHGVIIFAFFLFLIMAFTIVPIAVRTFFHLFEKMHAPYGQLPSWMIILKEKQMVLVYIVWGIYLAGLLMALPFMIKDGFFKP